MRIAIIEDEPAAVNRLKKELDRLDTFQFEIVAVLDSVQKTIAFLEGGSDLDLIFLDIHLTDGSSFQIFEDISLSIPVIFITAYDEYALKAFKVNSVDYLLKPIDSDELREALERFSATKVRGDQDQYIDQLRQLAIDMRPQEFRSSFLVSQRHKMKLIDVGQVAYIFVKERGVFLKMKNRDEYLIDFFLDDLEKQLDPSKFYRANRQFLIARSSIVEIEPYFNGKLLLTVNPEASNPVTVSKEKAGHFKRWADY